MRALRTSPLRAAGKVPARENGMRGPSMIATEAHDAPAVDVTILQVSAGRPAAGFSRRYNREGIVNWIPPKQPRVRLDPEQLREQVG